MKLTFFAAAVLLFGAAAADAQYVLDHFNCYQIQTTPPADAVVGLSDQFGQGNAKVQSKFRFCNPTAKVVQSPTGGTVVTPITHPDDHLTLYTIQSDQPPANLNVTVSNQFGEQRLTVFDARFLAVPTHKAPHPNPPVDLDHYQCYRASGQPIQRPAYLRDQFHPEQVRVNNPVLLCNPVKKQHNGAVTEVRHPDHHLVCYTKTPRQFVNTRDFRNQFESSQLITIASDLLCVPSKKAIVGPADAEE